MGKLGKITVLASAAEAARQWAKNNPDKAKGYIDKASRVVNDRTKGKYAKQVDGASAKAKDAVTKGAGPAGTANTADTAGTPAQTSTPAPPPPGQGNAAG